MATDLDPSIVAEYTQVVQRPDDGEQWDAQAINNLILPLANRIAYLNSGLLTQFWAGGQVKDDFFAIEEDTNRLSTSDGNWVKQEAGSATFNPLSSSVDADTFGELQINVSGAATGEYALRKALNSVRFSQIRRLSFRIKVEDITAGSGQNFEVGVCQANDSTALVSPDSVVAVHFHGATQTWRFRTADAAVGETNVTLATAPVSDTYARFEIVHDGAGAWTCSVNGGVATPAGANTPPLTDVCCPYIKLNVPSSGNRDVYIDFYDLQVAMPGRAA